MHPAGRTICRVDMASSDLCETVMRDEEYSWSRIRLRINSRSLCECDTENRSQCTK